MPIYEYECTTNKHRFEVIQKFSDPPATHCTVCGGPVERLLSAPAIQFKGSGWYITDYAKKGNGSSDGKEKASTDKDSAEKNQASESRSKPEASASSKSTGSKSSTGKSSP